MPAFTFSQPQSGIGLLTFDLPGKGANILSRPVLEEFAAHLERLERSGDLLGLIIASGKPGTFIAGADLREFAASLDADRREVEDLCRTGQRLFRRLSTAPFVTVAAIEGVCVGGGAELASWCDRRVFSTHPRTEFGFPEVKLGLFPGWGGTVRAPRLIGLANAIELICSGESQSATKAMQVGWGVDSAAPERLIAAATDVILEEQRTGAYLRDRERNLGPLTIQPTELGFLAATASGHIQQETKGNYPAPLAALELMLESSQLTADEALDREAAGMAELFGSPVNRALLNVFFLTDRVKRDTGLATAGASAQPTKSLGMVGAGIMGAGISAAAIKNEVLVTLYDASADAVAKGARQVIEEVAYDKKTKQPDAERALRFGPLLRTAQNDAALGECDLVIEAIVENLAAKRKLFAELEPKLRANTILASNTSTIPITKLAEGLARPEQFCGIHFFNPVRRMKLVEVIRGRATSDDTIASAVAFVKKIGKMPIVVNDGPAFMVNRLLSPYMNEAAALLMEGASPREVDKAATIFGMPIGPVALYDLVGLDTAVNAGRVMYEAFPNRVFPAVLVPALVKAGRLGVKSGRGFYSYAKKKDRGDDDPDAERIIANYRRNERQISRDEITRRLFTSMFLEATRLLDDNVVRDVRDIDLGLIFGLGFPAFRGGLLFWADTIGASTLLDWAESFAHIGPRYHPTERLRDMARSGAKFYGGGAA